MKHATRILSLLLALLFLTVSFAACGGSATPAGSPSVEASSSTSAEATPEASASASAEAPKFETLKLKVLGALQTGSRTPTEDRLTPIWREKTGIEPEIIEIPTGTDYVQWFQMQIVAGTMPDIITGNGIVENAAVMDLLKAEKAVRPITLEEMKQYMPLTQKRLEKYGVTLDEWYNDNLDYTDNQLYYIPGMPSPALIPALRNEKVVLNNTGKYPYMMFFRDDILKRIFPDVKTEQELKQLYVDKGRLAPEDVLDVPIKTTDDLYAYLLKVKELGLKVGEKEVIPCHPMMNADVSSLMWSMFSFPGFWWQEFGDRLTSSDKLTYFADTPEWKQYIGWMNRAYNDGLLGQEIFLQKDDQRNAKIINGEYAVFQAWNPVAEARAKSVKENLGYGFRMVPITMIPLVNAYQDNREQVLTLRQQYWACMISSKVAEKDIPQVLNLFDWNLSEEAATLRCWGTPDMYTGEGMDRRFKPEYQAVEQYLLSNGSKTADKDGAYYGIYRNNGVKQDYNHEIYGIAFTEDEYAPWQVYPETIDNADIDSATYRAIKEFYAKDVIWVRESSMGQDAKDIRAELSALETTYGELKATASFDCDGAKNATVKAIVGKPAEFDANYAAYEKFLTPEFRENVLQQQAVWAKYVPVRNKYRKVLD